MFGCCRDVYFLPWRICLLIAANQNPAKPVSKLTTQLSKKVTWYCVFTKERRFFWQKPWRFVWFPPPSIFCLRISNNISNLQTFRCYLGVSTVNKTPTWKSKKTNVFKGWCTSFTIFYYSKVYHHPKRFTTAAFLYSKAYHPPKGSVQHFFIVRLIIIPKGSPLPHFCWEKQRWQFQQADQTFGGTTDWPSPDRRYYALVALQSPQPSVRVAGLSMLTEVRWEGFLPMGMLTCFFLFFSCFFIWEKQGWR